MRQEFHKSYTPYHLRLYHAVPEPTENHCLMGAADPYPSRVLKKSDAFYSLKFILFCGRQAVQ